jgi:cytochrome c biogenesis protein CcmG/thiol:disulfide interchange protein DsbE
MREHRASPPRPRRRVGLLTVVAAATVALSLTALLIFGLLRRAPNTTIADSLASGRLAPAPAFDLEILDPGRLGPLSYQFAGALDDGRIALDELRGAPVVLNIWASWCDPCRQEAPILQRAWERARDAGVLFVGLDIQDTPKDGRSFLREFGIDYLTIREGDRSTAQAYGATGIPETYFLTADGRVAAHVIGVVTAAQLQAGIAAARENRPLAVQAGGDRRDPP